MRPTVRPPRSWKGRTLLTWTVLGGAAVFVFLALLSDFDALVADLSEFPPALLGGVALLSLGNYGLRYLKWEWYLRRMGTGIRPWPSALVFLSGFALTVTPGKVGEFVKAFILKRRHDIPYMTSTAVLLVERFTDVAAILLLCCLGLFGKLLPLRAAVLVAAALASSVALVRSRRLATWLIGHTSRVRPLKGFSEHLATLYGNGYQLLSPGILTGSMALSLVAWLLEGIGYTLVGWGYGVDITLLEGVFIYSAALMGGALTIFVGGLGATEGALVALGVAFGMTRDVSVASAMIIRLATLWFAVAIGWMVFLLTPGLRSLLAQSREEDGPQGGP